MLKHLAFMVLLTSAMASFVIYWESHESRKFILAATSLGVETIAHTDFVKGCLRETGLEGQAKVRIFLGTYKDILGSVGQLESLPPDYYIFLDMYFYYTLDQGEKEALIAHEIGHAIYVPDSQEQFQLKLEHKLRRQGLFKEWYDQISTKYQMKADEFSTRRTSIKSMTNLLDKLYREGERSLDYQLRVKNLKQLKQGP